MPAGIRRAAMIARDRNQRSVRESVPPGGCDTHADNLNRLAARLTDFRLCGREADEDKAGQHVSSEAVSEYKRLDEAARSCSAPRRGFRRRLPCFDERANNGPFPRASYALGGEL